MLRQRIVCFRSYETVVSRFGITFGTGASVLPCSKIASTSLRAAVNTVAFAWFHSMLGTAEPKAVCIGANDQRCGASRLVRGSAAWICWSVRSW